MKTCTYCKKENPTDASFCEGCGQDTFIKPKVFLAAKPEPIENDADPPLPEPDPDVEPGEDCILCPSCLFPNLPHVTWCKKCGVPISPTASITPLESAQSLGTVYRGAVSGKRSLVILTGVWLLFGPGLFCSSILFLSSLYTISRGLEHMALLIASLGSGLISLSILVLTTKNYLTKLEAEKEAAAKDVHNED